jgi:hypothetical protein
MALCAVILVAMVVSLFIRETPIAKAPPLDWQPFIRLVGMTAIFSTIILALGAFVNLVLGWVQNLPALSGNLLAGGAGLLAMLVAIVVGVFAATRVSLGVDAQHNRSFVWWVINRLAFLVGATNLATFMVFFLQEKFGYGANEAAGPAANAVLYVGIFILLTALPSGWLADRFGKKSIVVVAALLGGVGTGAVIVAPVLSGIYIGACLVGASLGFFYASSWALGTMIVPNDKAGHFLGVGNLAGAGAGAVGAYIGGPIADQFSYTLIITVYGIIVLLSLVALRWVKVEN